MVSLLFMTLLMQNHLTMLSSGYMKLTGLFIILISFVILIRISAFISYASENVNKLLVGNKSDLTSKRAVTFEQGKVSILGVLLVYYLVSNFNIHDHRNLLIPLVSNLSKHLLKIQLMLKKRF